MSKNGTCPEKQRTAWAVPLGNLALAELEAFASSHFHPTAHKTSARWGPRIESDALHHSLDYLLLNWKRLRAPFCPYFLRSLPRASRERKPSAFSFLRNSILNSSSARAMPIFKAPAWPLIPPPETLAVISKVELVSLVTSGCFTSTRCAPVRKYLSNSRPFTVSLPLPGRRKTRATLDLRRPVP